MKTWLRFLCGLGFFGVFAAACGGSDDTATNDRGTGGSGAGTGGGSGGLVNTGGSSGDAATCATAKAGVVSSPVDVIVTIDQSASMGEEIQGVIDNLNTNLLDILKQSNIDYRVIFVTSTEGLPTGPEFFQAPAPINSSDALTLLLWTYDGNYKTPNTCQKSPNPDVKWGDKLRYEAQKVFIAVTDDDPSSFDCQKATAACTSDCGGCDNSCAGYCPNHQCPTYADQPAAWGGGDFPTELYKLEPVGMFGTPAEPKWVFDSIVPVTQELGPSEPVTTLSDVCNSGGNTGETSGVEYQKLSVLTGGVRFPSCDTDYSPVFQSIAASIVPLACKFLLEGTNLGKPDPDKTNVTIDVGAGAQPVLKDDTKPCEAGADGWQFVDGDKAVVLCGHACDVVKQNPNAKVEITLGCDTEVRVR